MTTIDGASVTTGSVQLTLTLEPLIPVVMPKDATIQERFEAFHAANPWVYQAFVDLAADALDRGAQKVGIGMLTEVIRWQYGRQTQGDSFKVNNNFRSRYVRLMIANHPGWEQVFETRDLRAA
jgi:hypothetical protein